MKAWVSSLLQSLGSTGQNHIVERAHLLNEEDRVDFLASLEGLDIEHIYREATRTQSSTHEDESTPEISPPIA